MLLKLFLDCVPRRWRIGVSFWILTVKMRKAQRNAQSILDMYRDWRRRYSRYALPPEFEFLADEGKE